MEYFLEGKMIRISVVIPFYKEIGLISRAVSSVLAQRDAIRAIQFEILICNDGDYSTEEIQKVLAKNGGDNIRILKNFGRHGPGGARNCGLEQASGDYIAFLDADDYWLEWKISNQLDQMESGCSFVATSYKFEGSDTTIAPPRLIKNGLDVFQKLGIGTSTVLMRRSLCEDVRFRDIRFCQDIDFWHRLAHLEKFKYGSVIGTFVIYSPTGSTRNKLVQLAYFWKVLKLNRVGHVDMLIIIIKYSFRGVYNHYFRRMQKSNKREVNYENTQNMV